METIQSRLSGTRDYAGDDAVALRRARASLEATFQRYGYNIVDPPILERASPFLDRSGETIRRRMYIFSDPGGREVCLRPELTIPACRGLSANTGCRTRRRGSAIWARRSATTRRKRAATASSTRRGSS
ncbi:MAG: ATP phosphoribosyltransferase regulatory subunit [Rhizomicrobium sp.]